MSVIVTPASCFSMNSNASRRHGRASLENPETDIAALRQPGRLSWLSSPSSSSGLCALCASVVNPFCLFRSPCPSCPSWFIPPLSCHPQPSAPSPRPRRPVRLHLVKEVRRLPQILPGIKRRQPVHLRRGNIKRPVLPQRQRIRPDQVPPAAIHERRPMGLCGFKLLIEEGSRFENLDLEITNGIARSR